MVGGSPAAAPPAVRFVNETAFLAREGELGAIVYRVDRIREDLTWIAYVDHKRSPRTVIVCGVEDTGWSALRYMDGWPCPPVSIYEGQTEES